MCLFLVLKIVADIRLYQYTPVGSAHKCAPFSSQDKIGESVRLASRAQLLMQY